MPVIAKPPPSDEALQQWVELLLEGEITPFEAARKVPGPVNGHETLTRLRRYAQRGARETAKPREREWADVFAAAIEEYEEGLDDRLESEYVERALDQEKGANGSANRMLHHLALIRSLRRGRLEQFKPLLEARTRHIHEGAVGHYPMLDVSRLTDEELETLQALMAKAGSQQQPAQVDGPSPREIAGFLEP